MPFLEILQLGKERRTGRDVVRLAHQLAHAFACERTLLHEIQHEARAQNSGDLVRLDGICDQAPVIRGRDLLGDALQRRFEVDRLDLIARHHDVVDRDRLQIEQVDQDALVLLRQVAGLEHQRAQLFHAGLVLGAMGAHIDTHQAQESAHEQVHEPDERTRKPQQRREHMAGGQRDAFRIGGADHLGCDFAEHENHEGGGRRGDDEREFAVAHEPSRDLTDQKGGRGVDYIVAEQNDAQELIGLRQQIGGDARTAAALHEVAQPIPVERHHARFGNGEESGNDQQDE